MSRNIRCFLCFAALLLAPAVPAQQLVAPTEPRNGRIYLDVVVTEKSGLPVSGLKQQNFTILDNKVPQTITSFHAVDGLQAPVDVLIVIDALNAGYMTVSNERSQVDKFLRADGGNLAYPTSLAVLTDTGINTLKQFSKDGNLLSSLLDQYALKEEWAEGDSQALFDLLQGETSRPGRRIIIFVSPGWPLRPRAMLDTREQQQLFGQIVDFSTLLLRDRVTLYSIDPAGALDSLAADTHWESFVKGISKASQAEEGDLGLQVLATQSGGLALSQDNDIAALLQRCLADTRAYYEISFDPSKAGRPDEYHQLEVRIAKPGLKARTRQGYYSRAE